MFFKRFNKRKPDLNAALEAVVDAVKDVGAALLPAAALRRITDPEALGFKTTADLDPAFKIAGHDRALKAIEFGISVRGRDFNVFVSGPPASGKSTAVRSFLEAKAASAPPPSDWVYVNNFDDAASPRAIRLPPGRARGLARAMIAVIEELRATLPAAFDAEEYQTRKHAIDEEFRSGQEGAFEALSQKANSQNIAILRTPLGFTMAPMHEGKVVKPDVYNQLPETMRQQVEARVEAMQSELAEILSSAPKADKIRRIGLSELAAETASTAICAATVDVKAGFADIPEAASFIAAAEADLVRNAGLFLAASGEPMIVKEPIEVSRDPGLRRYLVNVLVSSQDGRTGVPIIEEMCPTFANLIGRVEHISHAGALFTDFLLIRPGALHKANGGYLLLDARDVALSPLAWEALKRVIKAGQLRFDPPADSMGTASEHRLDPQPIPLDVKVILFGDPDLYQRLSNDDPDFSSLFRVLAAFDEKIERNLENEKSYACLVAAIAAGHKLKPVNAAGVARIIDEGARLAGDSGKLTSEIGLIAGIVREADYWAGTAGRDVTTRDDVSRAIDERIQRGGHMRDCAGESCKRGTPPAGTEGTKVGQITALSVRQQGNIAFGHTSRITARVRMGQGRVSDLEREVNSGGPSHSRGVAVLWGYLAGRYAQDVPLALAASLEAEPFCGGAGGESATSAELYALLSALSDAPINQGLAVTGQVNQLGEVLAAGAVNEKIEGYFDACKTQGLNGSQGVLIARANAPHLMLREDIVEAVSAGKFAVHAVSTIDEGIEVLTGLKAGARDEKGVFPEGSINRRVEDKLKALAEIARAFSSPAAGTPQSGKKVS